MLSPCFVYGQINFFLNIKNIYTFVAVPEF